MLVRFAIFVCFLRYLGEFKFLYFFGERGLRVFGSKTRRMCIDATLLCVGLQSGSVKRWFHGLVCGKLPRVLKRFAQKCFALAVRCCLNVI